MGAGGGRLSPDIKINNLQGAKYLISAIFGAGGDVDPEVMGALETVLEMLFDMAQSEKERIQEQAVLELRYGLKDGKYRTLREISPVLGNVSVQRVSQIQNKALRRLRHPSYSRCLKDFLRPATEREATGALSPYRRHMRERKIKKPADRLEGAILKLAQALDTSRLSEIPQDENLRIIEALQVLQEKANAAHEHLSGAKPVQEADFQERQQP